jgi:PPP family 3-phenylpropionic acid transporter
VSVVTLYPLVNQVVPIGRIVRILPWLSVLVALFFLPTPSFGGLIVLSAVFGLLYPTQMPVLETTASLGAQRGVIVYGPVRLWGSVGFIVGTAVNGGISQLFGNALLLPLFVVGLVALAATSLLPLGDEGVASQTSGTLGAWGPLVRGRVFVLVLALAVIIQGSHAAYYAFSSLFLSRVGVAPWLIAVFIILAPLSEIVAFRASAPVADRWPITALLSLAVVGVIVRWTVWALPSPVWLLLLSQLLHSITFVMMQVGFLQTLRRHLSADLIAPAQGLYSALATGGATALLTAVAGAVFDTSAHLAFAVMGLWALLGVPLLVLLRRVEWRASVGTV